MHTDNLQIFLRSLFDNDPKARQTVEDFHSLLTLVYKNDPGLYRALFMRKESRELEMIKLAAPTEKANLDNFFDAGLLEHSEGSQCASAVMIHRNVMDIEDPDLNPVPEWFVATDWPDMPSDDGEIWKAMVFPIHYESVYLLRKLHDTHKILNGKRCLDIFCGSGILGVFAALMGAEDVVCADISERALSFTRFNAILNGKEDVIRLSRTDLFGYRAMEDLGGKQFDIILANPPFEPAPELFKEKYFTHSYGGEYGDTVIQPFLDQVDEYLADKGGLFAVTFTCGTKTVPTGLECWECGSKTYSPRLRLGKLAEYHGEVEAFDSIPLDQFCLHLRTQTTEEQEQVVAWRQKLAAECLDRLYLVSVKIQKEAGSLEKKQMSMPSPCDWSVPLNWYLPCGFPTNTRPPVKVLLIDPPMHSYFSSDSVMRDQGKQLEMPLNLLCLGTYIRERFPLAATIQILHFDYELFRAYPGLADEVTDEEGKAKEVRYATDSEVLAVLDKWLDNNPPAIVGVGSFTVQAELAEKILQLVRRKNPAILTIAGGPHVAFQYRDFFINKESGNPILDFAVMGEGEYAFEDIVRGFLMHECSREKFVSAVEGGSYEMPRNAVTPSHTAKVRSRTRAEDILPMMLDLLPGGQPSVFLGQANIIIHTKRGCRKRCEFCISSRFFETAGSKHPEVVRPLEYVCAEIQSLKALGCLSIFIMDETFHPVPSKSGSTGNIQFELCMRLAKNECEGMDFVIQTRANLLNDTTLALMKASRITTIMVGIESASDDMLVSVHKEETLDDITAGIRRAKDFGFQIGAFWILGLPGATQVDDEKTIAWIENTDIVDWHEVGFFVPFPGTAYFPKGINAGDTICYGNDPNRKGRPLNFRFLNAGRPRFSEWHRFGHLRSGKPVGPVFETDIYTEDKLISVMDRLKDCGAIVNPLFVPHVADAKTQQLLGKTLSKVTENLARRFEEDIEDTLAETRSGGKEQAENLESMAARVFFDLDEKGTNLSKEKKSIADIALDCMQEFNCEIKDPRWNFESVAIIPVHLDSRAENQPTAHDVVRLIDSNIQAVWYPVVGDVRKRDVLEKGGKPLEEWWKKDCVYSIHYYSTHRDTPFLLVGSVSHAKSQPRFRLLTKEEIDDRENLTELIRITESNLQKEWQASLNPNDTCSAKWLIVIGLKVTNGFSFRDDDNRRDHETRLNSQGAFEFLDAFVRAFMSNLAGRLALKLQSEINEEVMRERQYHVLHDLKNLVSDGDWLRDLADDLRGRLPRKLKEAKNKNTPDAIANFADELMTYMLTGTGFGEDRTNADPCSIATLAVAQRRLNKVIWANVAIYRRQPERWNEADTPRTLLAFFSEEFFKRYKTRWATADGQVVFHVRLFLNDDSEPEAINLSNCEECKLERTLYKVFGDRRKKLPCVTLFDIVIPELIRNVVNYADIAHPVDIRLQYKMIDGSDQMAFFITNHVDQTKIGRGRGSLGIGTRRIKEALCANMDIKQRDLAYYFPIVDPLVLPDCSVYSTGFRLSFTRYEAAILKNE